MNAISYLLFVTLAGTLSVTLIATAGAALSRKLNFNYGCLTVLSLLVYMLIAYFILNRFSVSTALLFSNIVGFYDATVCWKLCKKYGANFGELADEIEKTSLHSRLLMVFSFASLCTLLSYWFF